MHQGNSWSLSVGRNVEQRDLEHRVVSTPGKLLGLDQQRERRQGRLDNVRRVARERRKRVDCPNVEVLVTAG